MKKRIEKICFIINPISGVGRQKIIEKLLEKHLDFKRFDASFLYTEGPNQATGLARKAVESGASIVVAVGGDGSINHVAKGLLGSGVTMGIIPTGSGNGLAHHLKIPFRLGKAIELLNTGKTRKIDTVSINDDLFVSIAGVGFDALVAEKFENSPRRGFFSYFKIITREFYHYQPQQYTIKANGQTRSTEALFISLANSDQFGYNASIAPKADIYDGLLDVCIIRKPPMVLLPIQAQMLFLKKIEYSNYIETFKTRKLVINQGRKQVINLDGERISMEPTLKIKVNPASLKVIVP